MEFSIIYGFFGDFMTKVNFMQGNMACDEGAIKA